MPTPAYSADEVNYLMWLLNARIDNLAAQFEVPPPPPEPEPEPEPGSWPADIDALGTLTPTDLPLYYTAHSPVNLTGVSVTNITSETGVALSAERFYCVITGGNAVRPKGNNNNWTLRNGIIHGHSDTVNAPTHGDLVHALWGSGVLKFEQMQIGWDNSVLNPNITAHVYLEGWSGRCEFTDVRFYGVGGYFPFRPRSCPMVFTRCVMPPGWSKRERSDQAAMTLTDCVDHTGQPIPDGSY